MTLFNIRCICGCFECPCGIGTFELWFWPHCSLLYLYQFTEVRDNNQAIESQPIGSHNNIYFQSSNQNSQLINIIFCS